MAAVLRDADSRVSGSSGSGPTDRPRRSSTALSKRTTLRVLRERNFALYFVGNLASNCGTWFQVIAQSLLVYRLTSSTFLVGVTNFAMFIAVVLLAPWAGSAADRF